MRQFRAKIVGLVLIALLGLTLAACTRAREEITVDPDQGVTVREGLPSTEEEGSPTTIAIQPTPTATTENENQPDSQNTSSSPATPTPIPAPTQTPTATPVTSIQNPNSGSTTDYITHIVQRGENLYRIGRTYAVSVEELVRFNGLPNPNTIYVGQEIKIPNQPTANDGFHVVQPGDTLLSIAVRYGTTSAVLQQLNNLANPNLIYVGQQIKLP